MIEILFSIGVMLIILFALNLVTSHGKSRFSNLQLVFYGLAAGVPLALVSYLIWVKHDSGPLTRMIYFTGFGFVSIILAIKWAYVIKGRETLIQALSLSIGVILIYSSFLFSPFQAMFLIGLGYLFMALFFINMFRYPYLHPGWLASAIDEVSREVKSRGKYSSKPVVIKKNFNKRFFTGAKGLSLLIKKDKVVCRISWKLYQKLGEPNLEEFFEKLVERIQKK